MPPAPAAITMKMTSRPFERDRLERRGDGEAVQTGSRACRADAILERGCLLGVDGGFIVQSYTPADARSPS